MSAPVPVPRQRDGRAFGARVLVRRLGRQPYAPVWRAMQSFTETRGPDSNDELWCVEHEPVFTLGLAGRPEHVLSPGDIPVLQVDRGGQVTYHGPGQLVVYPLLDLRRAGLGVRALVSALENSVIDLLAGFGVAATARADAPGVYVGGAKIASVGLRIRRGASYHGVAINVDADLQPFRRINPCGFADLPVTRLADLCPDADVTQLTRRYVDRLLGRLGRQGLDVRPLPDALLTGS